MSEDDSNSSKEEENKKKDLYSILGVKKTATNEEIRAAYRRLVLIYHPDKNEDKKAPNSAAKFIEINEAYKILSDIKTRKIYDETGEYEEIEKQNFTMKVSINDFRKRFTIKNITNYEKKYRGSEEEEQDLIFYYNQNQGDLRNLIKEIPFSTNKDIKRFLEIYEKLFKMKKLIRNQKYEETKNKIILMRKNKEEEKQAKEMLDKLTKQINERREKRNLNDYLSDLVHRSDGLDDGDETDEKNNIINQKEFQEVFKDLKKRKKKNGNWKYN